MVASAETPGTDADRLVGSWTLVSYEITAGGTVPEEPYGPRPRGRLMLGANGRMAVVMAAGERR